MLTVDQLEQQRLVLQAQLDAQKTPLERNQLGQYATPTRLAREVVGFAFQQLGSEASVKFLDPAIGTGSFYSAALSVIPRQRFERARGYDIDPHYAEPAQQLWQESGLEIIVDDFTTVTPPLEYQEKANLLISNPPYVRHHHINSKDKTRLQNLSEKVTGNRPKGTTGLYAYFMFARDQWMAQDGIAAWLIPSEFMDVNYGVLVRQYLLEKVSIVRIHRYSAADVQFNDALVSSAIIILRKQVPSSDHSIEFSYGGTLSKPETIATVSVDDLVKQKKWNTIFQKTARQNLTSAVSIEKAKLSDFFTVKRGLATGCNDFFILSAEDAQARGIPAQFLTPILPTARYLRKDEIQANANGQAAGINSFLLNCSLPEEHIEAQYPQLNTYLRQGKAKGVDQGYLCKGRKPWYSQENRPAAPFLCTYMGRSATGNPFRFILNHTNATATNAYLMLYPKPVLQRYINETPDALHRIWAILQAIHPQSMIDEGRVYGGGLHKVEPKELASVPVPELAALLQPQPTQLTLELS